MAYNNYFPMNYQQYYPQQMQGVQNIPQQNPQQQSNGTNLIWVQGEAGAKSYLVAPNSTVTLWDTESEVIYVKSADASGMPSMKVLDYKIRGASEPQNVPMQNGFATKDDLDALRADVNALKAKIEEEKK
jgi:hypothetical protein